MNGVVQTGSKSSDSTILVIFRLGLPKWKPDSHIIMTLNDKIDVLKQRLHSKFQAHLSMSIDLLQKEGPKISWEGLKSKLTIFIAGKLSEGKTMAKMRRLNQDEGELWRPWVNRAIENLQIAWGSTPTADQIYEHVVEGATPSYRHHISTLDCSDNMQLLEAVEEWEEREQRYFSKSKPIFDIPPTPPVRPPALEYCPWCSKLGGHGGEKCVDHMYCDRCCSQTHPRVNCES